MWLGERLSLIFKFVLVELIILALIGVIFYFQFDNAKSEFVDKTRAVAETIGDQASVFYENIDGEPTSNEFYLFLDQRLGRKKLFNTLDISPKFFSVVFKRDVEIGSVSGYFMRDFYPEGGYSVKKRNGMISVLVPFMTEREKGPFGVVKIDSETKTLIKTVFFDNFLLYVAILVVLNNQAFILHLFFRRKKEDVMSERYLKEHSIGSLKIMHKILGDVIADHSLDDKGSRDADMNQEGTKKIISINELASKRKK